MRQGQDFKENGWQCFLKEGIVLARYGTCLQLDEYDELSLNDRCPLTTFRNVNVVNSFKIKVQRPSAFRLPPSVKVGYKRILISQINSFLSLPSSKNMYSRSAFATLTKYPHKIYPWIE